MKLSAIITASLTAIALSSFSATKDAAQLYQSATKEFDSNRFESSVKLYLQADSAYVAEGKGNTANYAQALHSTGRAYFNAGKMEEGREYTRKAMELRKQLLGENSKEYITSLNNYALSYSMAGDPTTALRHQQKVVELCRKMNPPHPDEGMYLINLGRFYSATGDTANAAKYMEEALPKVEKFGQNYEYALNFLGNLYMETEDNANMNRIMGLMEEHNRHELEKECNDPECHLERAEYYNVTGDPAHAKEEYMTVFAMPLTDSQKAIAYSQYARFLFGQRDFGQAADYFAMAAEATTNDAGRTSEESTALLQQAALCFFLGQDYNQSIERHNKVIAEVDENGYSEKIKSTSLQGLGNAYSAKKDYDNSIAACRRWINHLEKNGHTGEADFAKAYERLASAEKFKGDYDASIANYEKAIELYGKLGMYDEQQQASAGLKMCLFYAKKDMGGEDENLNADRQREEKMREIIRSSVNTLEQAGDYLGKLFTAQSYATIAGSYAQLSDYNNAVDYFGKYISAIRPALAEDFILKTPRERELTWRQELGNLSEMNALISELPENTPDLYARLSKLIYEGQLLSKGILLSSNIEFDKILSRYGTKEMLSQYDAIKKNLAEIERMQQERRPIETILELTRKTEAMQLALARESAKYGIYTDFLNISAEDIGKALKDDEAAVEFFTLDTSILPQDNMVAAVLISKEFPTGLTIPIGSVARIQSIIDDSDRFSKDEYAAFIWGGIVQATPGKKRIYFAPDGILNNIGIEYLTFGGKPMSEQIDLQRLSSTREIVREHPGQPVQYVALFGDIDYVEDGLPASDKKKYARKGAKRSGFERLEESGREVNEISSILKANIKKGHVFSYMGAKASKAEFLSQEEVPVNILHIATHGQYIDDKVSSDADAMTRSILAFAGASMYDSYSGDGFVNAAEIADMTLQDCDLAVLSACESGLGKLGNDGVFGLQRGFKNAGVKSLLVSLNEVLDTASADMMIAFYRNLYDGSGKTKREALRKAQAEIRSKYPGDNTWGDFILIDSFN